MIQKEKDLVVKDLCGRLPFHVKVAIDFEGYLKVLPDDEDLQYPYRKNLNFILDYSNKTIEDISKEPHILYAYPCTERFAMLRGYTYELDYGVPVEFIKPYLRPVSSMSEKDVQEIRDRLNNTSIGRIITKENFEKCCDFLWFTKMSPFECVSEKIMDVVISYLDEHHFDYRGLIEKGLALEAPEDMYKFE